MSQKELMIPFRILFNVLYGETPSVINLEDYVTKPSDANFIRREVCVAEISLEIQQNLLVKL